MRVKKFLKCLIICLIISSMTSLTVLADDFDWGKFPCVSPESVLLSPEQTVATFRFLPKTRGNFISTAVLSISNEGGGVVGVFAQTLTHYPIDKCRMRIYLDRWYEDRQDWVMQDYWDVTFLKENEEGGILTMPAVSFNVENQPTGYHYRLRSLHAVWLNGVSEGLSAQTHGVLITN